MFRRFGANALMAVFIVLLLTQSQCEKDDPFPADLGTLSIFPQEILINTATEFSVQISVSPGLNVEDTILLIKTSPDGSTSDVGFLLDNGDLSQYGDEIKGDGIYSGKVFVSESTAGELKFKASAKVDGSGYMNSNEVIVMVYNDLPTGAMKTVLDVQKNMSNQLNQYLGGSQANADNAINQMVNWLQDQPGVESATRVGATSVEITYTSGLKGGAIISLLNQQGQTVTRGGLLQHASQDIPRHEVPVVPMHKQTRGENFPEDFDKAAFDPNTIGNRNVFIYAPYEAEFHPYNERQHIINILDSLDCGEFSVTSYVNQAANVGRLYEMVNYGMVVIATHGSDGNVIMTGEVADTTQAVYQTYKPMLQGVNPKMGIYANITVSWAGIANTKANIYVVYSPFIAALPGTFPQSVILNNSCESDKTALLKNAFFAKGAKTYYGYDKVVPSDFCIYRSRDVFIELARENKTTGSVSSINTTSGAPLNAKFTLSGSGTMKYALDLMNGDFANGLMGWTKVGDGRAISQLGFLTPQTGNYMGIISTGLGYTTLMGSISQSFLVPNNVSELNMKWNFLSEEFLEYIGSQYQDTFEVLLISEEYGTEILMRKTIDDIAAEFGAFPPSDEYPDGIAGDLIYVSPDIVFDRGDVYMTGWQSSSFNITGYQGKCVSLVLRCTDVGDSIFDTAVLLDDIELK